VSVGVEIFSAQHLDELLTVSAAHHRRVCPRQVLGARMGLFAGHILEIAIPQTDKRLLAISETDGCFVDGISAATGCYVGRRTMRIEDYGKTAATFIDTLSGQAIRIRPKEKIRDLAWEYAPSARNKWEAQLIGYQHIPDCQLLHWHRVNLIFPLKKIIGQAGGRVTCEICGEEIINQREVVSQGKLLCKSCLGESYFSFI
jgi:formylmethanofuran dehydrogenase subunit E